MRTIGIISLFLIPVSNIMRSFKKRQYLRFFFGLILFVIQPFSSIAQTPDKIHWTVDSKLNWSDFKGKPQKNHPMAAETSTHLDFNMAYENAAFNWDVDCYFSRKESWVKKDMKSPELLAHEQLHFDIAELNARKIRSEMSQLKLKSIDDNRKLQSVFEKGYERMSKQQAQYDRETDHGQLDGPQSKWIEEIAGELKKYENFATEKYLISE